jgi:hypothetical protein
LEGWCRDEIVLWVRKKTGFAVTTLQSKDEAEYFLRKKVTAVLGYFNKLEVRLTPVASSFLVYIDVKLIVDSLYWIYSRLSLY